MHLRLLLVVVAAMVFVGDAVAQVDTLYQETTDGKPVLHLRDSTLAAGTTQLVVGESLVVVRHGRPPIEIAVPASATQSRDFPLSGVVMAVFIAAVILAGIVSSLEATRLQRFRRWLLRHREKRPKRNPASNSDPDGLAS
jgi:hypothetical protein